MVRAILADANIQGQVAGLVHYIERTDWCEYWTYLGLSLQTFADLNLHPDSPDAEIWRVCQRENLVLLTANRNEDGPDSLQTTIRTESTPESLPVLTISDIRRLQNSGEYAERVVTKLFEVLLNIDGVRGTGRLYLP
jgi:hypothetical protein